MMEIEFFKYHDEGSNPDALAHITYNELYRG